MYLKTVQARRCTPKTENFRNANWREPKRSIGTVNDYHNFNHSYNFWNQSKVLIAEQKIPLKLNNNKFISRFDVSIAQQPFELFTSFLSRSQEQISSVVQQNPDCMCLAYSPTKKLVDDIVSGIIPGHIFIYNTDENGQIVENEMISARPDATRKDEGYEVIAIDNPKLHGFSRTMRVIPVKFTSFSEEIEAWAKLAYRDSKYPLTILTVPFDAAGITKEFYRKNSYKIRERSRWGFYALLSHHDPITGEVRENLNCIRYVTMFFEEIFSQDFKNKLGVDPTTQYAGAVFASEICKKLGSKDLIQKNMENSL